MSALKIIWYLFLIGVLVAMVLPEFRHRSEGKTEGKESDTESIDIIDD